jgi:hypothetical protein
MMYQAATRDFDSLGEGADHGEPMACSIRDRLSTSPLLFLPRPISRSLHSVHPSLHISIHLPIHASICTCIPLITRSCLPRTLGHASAHDVGDHHAATLSNPQSMTKASHLRVVVHIKVADLLLMACGSGKNAPWHSPDISTLSSPLASYLPPPLLPIPADTRGPQSNEYA